MPERRGSIADWQAEEHIDRACELVAEIDPKVGRSVFVQTPVHLTLAQLHLQIADLKIKAKR